MFYSIRHITRFRYSQPVHESVMELRMQPRSEGAQSLRNFQIVTNPRAQLYAYTDYLGNAVYHFNVLRAHEELRIDVQAVVEVTPRPEFPASADALEWQRYNTLNLGDDHFDLMEPSKFAVPSQVLREFTDAHGLTRPDGDPLTALRRLNKAIYETFDYEQGVTQVHSPIDTALNAKRGVCQDFAHIMISGLRGLGLPAAYVSGYLRTVPRSGAARLEGADAMHAWVMVWCGDAGWWGLDPTNALIASDDHVVLAIGRDYADAAPIGGVMLGSGAQRLNTAVDVIPVAT